MVRLSMLHQPITNQISWYLKKCNFKEKSCSWNLVCDLISAGNVVTFSCCFFATSAFTFTHMHVGRTSNYKAHTHVDCSLIKLSKLST